MLLSRRRRLVLLLCLLPALAGGGLFASPLWPRWTSLTRAKLPDWTKRYDQATRANSEAAPVGSFLHIGHRAGSFEEYARTINGELPTRPRAVTELMDLSFTELGLNAIEIDVRRSPLEGDTSAVVVHDRISPGDLSRTAREYIRANTLSGLLRHYLAKGYHVQGKRIFVELKASNAAKLDVEARESIDRTAAALTTTLQGRADAETARRHVELISFNQHALEHARQALGTAAKAHKLHLILTSNRHPEFTYQLIRSDLRPVDASLVSWLGKTSWVNGVLFDPRYVEGFASLFNRLNRKRERRGLAPLALHLSTYSHDFAGFVERLSAAGQRLRHVRGLVYEVRKGE